MVIWVAHCPFCGDRVAEWSSWTAPELVSTLIEIHLDRHVQEMAATVC